jgi:hypothetical protein
MDDGKHPTLFSPLKKMLGGSFWNVQMDYRPAAALTTARKFLK